MSLSIAIGVLVVIYILSRQLRVRIVPRVVNIRFSIILAVIGLFDLSSYTGSHHVTIGDFYWVVGSLVFGSILLGALRALTVKIWVSNNWVVRQGTWLTMALWAISLLLHFAADFGSGHTAVANLEASSLLLYLGVTYGVQNYVVHRRATPLWNSLGPEAGQRIQVNFGQGPGGANSFFATFRGGQGFGQGFPPPQPPPRYDPTIIDAEVVEDDDGPAELHRPDG